MLAVPSNSTKSHSLTVTVRLQAYLRIAGIQFAEEVLSTTGTSPTGASHFTCLNAEHCTRDRMPGVLDVLEYGYFFVELQNVEPKHQPAQVTCLKSDKAMFKVEWGARMAPSVLFIVPISICMRARGIFMDLLRAHTAVHQVGVHHQCSPEQLSRPIDIQLGNICALNLPLSHRIHME